MGSRLRMKLSGVTSEVTGVHLTVKDGNRNTIFTTDSVTIAADGQIDISVGNLPHSNDEVTVYGDNRLPGIDSSYFSFTGLGLIVEEAGLETFSVDKIVMLGASITNHASSENTVPFVKSYVKSKYGKDIEIVNEAVSGWRVADVRTNAGTILDKYVGEPNTRVFLHIGGGDIGAGFFKDNPDSVNKALFDDLHAIYDIAEERDIKLYQSALTFRDYGGVTIRDTPEEQKLVPKGSYSYTRDFITEVMKARAPDLVRDDWPVINQYDLTRNMYAEWRDPDDLEDYVHPGDLGRVCFLLYAVESILQLSQGHLPPVIEPRDYSKPVASAELPVDAVYGFAYTTVIDDGLKTDNINWVARGRPPVVGNEDIFVGDTVNVDGAALNKLKLYSHVSYALRNGAGNSSDPTNATASLLNNTLLKSALAYQAGNGFMAVILEGLEANKTYEVQLTAGTGGTDYTTNYNMLTGTNKPLVVNSVSPTPEDNLVSATVRTDHSGKVIIAASENNAVSYAAVGGIRIRSTQPVTNLILNHSQSLGIGDKGMPLVHDTPQFGQSVKMFTGLPPIGKGYELGIESTDLDALVPMREVARETHTTAMINWLQDSGVLPENTLYASTGVGGKTIKELTDDIEGQTWGLANVNMVIDRTASLGAFTMPFTTWIHGEANSGAVAGYKPELREYHNHLISRVGSSVPMIMDQTGKASSLDIANTLLEYSQENEDAFLAGPKYWLNRLYPESGSPSLRLHLNSQGYMLQGEMIAECARQVLSGIDYKPVHVESMRVIPGTNYKEAELVFHVPNGGTLTVDDVTLPAAPAYGLQIDYFRGHAPVEPIDIIITGNTVRLKFDQPITTDAYISAGNSLDDRADTDGTKLPCINLRSSIGHTSLYVPGYTWYDWCVQFKQAVTVGALNVLTGNLWHYGDFNGTLTDNEIGLGNTADWIIEQAGATTLSYDVTVTSGQLHIWVAGTRTIVSSTSTATVDIPADTQKRLYIQAGSRGFEGTASITVTKKLAEPWHDPETKVINPSVVIPEGEVIN